MLRSFPIAFALLVMTLLIASPTRAECPECRAHCGYGAQGDWCMTTCPCDSDYGPGKPAQVFGSLAYSRGDGFEARSSNYSTSRQAIDGALAYCRANSKVPKLCRTATWYVNSCGALAIADKGSWSVGGGNDATVANRAQAESIALDGCRRAGFANCRLVTSGCATDLTPEQAAANAKAQGAIIATMDKILGPIWGGKPSAPATPIPAHPRQIVSLCTPLGIDARGNPTPGADAARRSGAMERHWDEIDHMVDAMKREPHGRFGNALADGRGHVQLFIPPYDEPRKIIVVKPVASARALSCPAGFRTVHYDAAQWRQRPGLNPRDLDGL